LLTYVSGVGQGTDYFRTVPSAIGPPGDKLKDSLTKRFRLKMPYRRACNLSFGD